MTIRVPGVSISVEKFADASCDVLDSPNPATESWKKACERQRRNRMLIDKTIRAYEDQVLRDRDMEDNQRRLQEELELSQTRKDEIRQEYEAQIKKLAADLESRVAELQAERELAAEDQRQIEAQFEREREWKKVLARRENEALAQRRNQMNNGTNNPSSSDSQSGTNNNNNKASEMIALRKMISARESEIQAYQRKVVEDCSALQMEIDALRADANRNHIEDDDDDLNVNQGNDQTQSQSDVCPATPISVNG